MFYKTYDVEEQHLDFQHVVDGLYYPFYMEWARHAYMKEVLGLDLHDEFKQGRLHMLVEYSLRFKKSLVRGETMTVSCQLQANEKKTRVNFIQQIKVNDKVYAEGVFVATCLINGRPGLPEVVKQALLEAN